MSNTLIKVFISVMDIFNTTMSAKQHNMNESDNQINFTERSGVHMSLYHVTQEVETEVQKINDTNLHMFINNPREYTILRSLLSNVISKEIIERNISDLENPLQISYEEIPNSRREDFIDNVIESQQLYDVMEDNDTHINALEVVIESREDIEVTRHVESGNRTEIFIGNEDETNRSKCEQFINEVYDTYEE